MGVVLQQGLLASEVGEKPGQAALNEEARFGVFGILFGTSGI